APKVRRCAGHCATNLTKPAPIGPPATSRRGMADALLPGGVAIAAGLWCWIATGALIPILRRRDVLDHPNARSSHRVPTPRGGGIAVTGVVLLAWLVLYRTGSATTGLISISVGAGV